MSDINDNTPAGSVSDANVAPATPDYKKWYTPAPMPLTAEQGTPVQPGQIFASGSDNRDQDPPTNGESYNMNEPFSIPTDVDADGNPVPVTAKLSLTYNVEDWGTASLDGEQIIDLSDTEAATGPRGGHTTWGKTANAVVQSGSHNLDLTYQNITMPNPELQQNRLQLQLRSRSPRTRRQEKPRPLRLLRQHLQHGRRQRRQLLPADTQRPEHLRADQLLRGHQRHRRPHGRQHAVVLQRSQPPRPRRTAQR